MKLSLSANISKLRKEHAMNTGAVSGSFSVTLHLSQNGNGVWRRRN